VPLLLEHGGLRPLVERVLIVDCSEEQQRQRVMARSGMTEPEVRSIMAAQASRSARLAVADDVIDNSGPRELLPAKVAALDARYRALAAGRDGTPAPDAPARPVQ
jgi:dephospho-CoA kinase